MGTVEIKATDLERVLRARIRADKQLARLAGYEAALRGVPMATAATEQAGAVDQRHFQRSWDARLRPDGAELINDAPYAAIIEWGRRPGQPGPPIEPIREWVHRKLVLTGQVDAKDADGIAWAIRQRIHDRGTPPKFILRGLKRDLGRIFLEEVLKRLR